jgi:hypothetical protein
MMMLKAFFLSQVVDSSALPQDGAGNRLLPAGVSVTGVPSPDGHALRRGLDGHVNILGRQLSKHRDVYLEALNKSVWGRSAVVATAFIFPLQMCLALIVLALPKSISGLIMSVLSEIAWVVTLTSVIFALRHTTGWLVWNTRILFVSIIVNILFWLTLNLITLLAYFKVFKEATTVLMLIAFTANVMFINYLVMLIPAIIHYVFAVCIPTYRLWSKAKGLRI